MANETQEIIVNGVAYVPKNEDAKRLGDKPYVIVRTYSAGVFAGWLERREGKEGTIRHARRIWYWSGAASLSQLAMHGPSDPDGCKFPCEVDKIEVTEIIEVLSVTEKARTKIKDVPVWTK